MSYTHEVETAFQRAQLGIEALTSYGTPVPATIALGAVTIKPALKRTMNETTPQGYLLPTVQATSDETTEMSFDGPATYEDLAYLIQSIVSDAQIDPLLYTVESGGLQIPGAVVTAWTLKGEGNKPVAITGGKMIGKAFTVAAATPGLTPAAQTPITGTGTVITINDTPIEKRFDWELAVSDLWDGKVFQGDPTFATIFQKQIKASFKFKIEADGTGLAHLAVGDVVQVIITCTDGAHSLTITFSGKYGEPAPLSDEGGIYGIQHTISPCNVATTAIEIAVV